jgi:UDP-perosamine 4-acetyltransferase
MKANEIVMIGGGGHSRVLVGLAKASGLTLRGIVTGNPALIGTHIFGVPILGLEDDVALNATHTSLINGVGNAASGKGAGLATRKAIYERYTAQGFTMLSLISPHAMVQTDVTLHDAVQVMAGAVIQPGCVIEHNVIINTSASIDHDCRIGAHSHIAPGAILSGEVVVGQECHIGAGAVITQGVHIGHHAVIGAGAIVTRDVPDNVIVRPVMGEQSPLISPPHA